MPEFNPDVHFESDRPCKRGHVGWRYIKGHNCVDCVLLTTARNATGNKEATKARHARYREKNKDAINARIKKWCDENRERRREIALGWYYRNPEASATHSRNWHARRKNAEGTHTLAEIQEIFARQGGKCATCRKRKKLTVDHIIPLSRGGRNDAPNLQGLCLSCNSAKGAKDAIDFMQSRGFLL